MAQIMDLFLKEQKGPTGGFYYPVELTAEQATKLAEILGCLPDTSTSIPKELPAFSKNDECILIETGFGISFQESERKDVDIALESIGFNVYDADRSWD